jgi:hypothetical protein
MANPRKEDAAMADPNGKPMLAAQQATIADSPALTGGQSPTEAEHNALAVTVNSILAALEAHGLVADA